MSNSFHVADIFHFLFAYGTKSSISIVQLKYGDAKTAAIRTLLLFDSFMNDLVMQ